MKYYAVLIIGCLIFSFEGSPPKSEYKEIDHELQEIFNMQPGDSIPLDFAKAQYDSLFSEKNATIVLSSIELQAKLDSLKSKQLLDPENNALKFEIEYTESILNGVSLIEEVMDDIDRRDSMIKDIMPDFDSIARAINED